MEQASTGTIVAIIIGLIIANILLFIAVYIREQRKNFKRHLKVGDKVDRYDGNERKKYTLEKYGDIWSEIRNEDTGNLVKEYTINLYPNFWFNYGIEKCEEKIDLEYGKKPKKRAGCKRI